MYVYCIRDDITGMYMIGRMKLGAPVPTCVWGERRADAMTFENITIARNVLIETAGSTASIYRLNVCNNSITKAKSGGDGQ